MHIHVHVCVNNVADFYQISVLCIRCRVAIVIYMHIYVSHMYAFILKPPLLVTNRNESANCNCPFVERCLG